MCSDSNNFVLSGGSLTVTAGSSSVGGSFQVSPGATLTASNAGTSFTVTGVTDIDGANLYASGGATLAFPNVASYAGPTAFDVASTLQASGTGSHLDLSHLTSLTGATGGYAAAAINAKAGGVVSLGNVASNPAGAVAFSADGAGSTIDLSKLAAIVNTITSDNSSLSATNGGFIALKASSTSGSNTGIIIGVGGSLSVSGIVQINGTGLVNNGDLVALDGSSLTVNAPITLNGSARFWDTPTATISFGSNVLGNTRNADLFDPLGAVVFNGSGTASSPQQFEVMGDDLGSANSSFPDNFLYNSIALANNTYVKLVDLSDNSGGTGPEALYVNTISVPSGSTLDLNGLHVYARGAVIAGTVLNGTITQTPDSGAISFASPTPGQISIVGQDDEWTFFGRAGQSVTINVDPGSSGSTVQLTPYLAYASVQILGLSGNVLASASSATIGQLVTLPSVNLPADGTYRIEVRAGSSHPTNIGNYVIGLFDSTPSVSQLPLDQEVNGTLSNPYSVNDWTFSSSAGQQVLFDLINSSSSNIKFDLTGPNGWSGFVGLSGNSGPVTLPTTGSYTIKAYGTGGLFGGAYAFELVSETPINLTPNIPYQGTLGGSGSTELFSVDVPINEQLLISLSDNSPSDQNQVYLKYGEPPTLSDYQYRYQAVGANQQVLAPAAAAGTWYVLVYSTSVPSPSNYTITATTANIVLTSSTPASIGNGSDMTLTLEGAGFDPTTTVELIASNGTIYMPRSTTIDLPTQITTTFAAGSVPAGEYTIQVSKPGFDPTDLPDSLTITAGGRATLRTHLVVPSVVGRHQTATLYVQYSNTGTVAMPAPLLFLTGTQKPLLTLDPTKLVEGLWTSAIPSGFSNSIELLGGGSTPGILQPGESESVPVYYAGLVQPWDFNSHSVTFNLTVTTANDATPINWAAMENFLQPPTIDSATWAAIYPGLTSGIGSTWGDFVKALDADANYLGQLGEKATSISQLWDFEVRQAIGLTPVSLLASNTDAAVAAPGLALTLGRAYSPSILSRNQVGPLGLGWTLSGGWQTTLSVASDGTVSVTGVDGDIREFQPDSRTPGSYFDQVGDHGTLINDGDGTYSLREQDGSLTHFLANGHVDYVQDTNGNRITAGYISGLLTSLTQSDGQSLQIAYNTAGRITSVTDPFGRQTTYTYDASNQHLMSVREPDGTVYGYTYDLGSNPATEDALLSIADPDGTHEYFAYDGLGRLAGSSMDGGADPVTYMYGPVGQVDVTDATNDVTQLFFDDRGLLVKAIDPLGNASYQSFDANFNLVSSTDASGLTSLFQYNSQGNLVSATDPLGSKTGYTYTGPDDELIKQHRFCNFRLGGRQVIPAPSSRTSGSSPTLR